MTIDLLNQMKKSNTFLESVIDQEQQTWYLDHIDIYENDFFTVKKFTTHDAEEAVFINPPRAGHHSNIAQTLIKYYTENTDYTIYSCEHKPATQKTKDYGIEEIVEQVSIIKSLITECDEIHLVGLCQGGWANVMWASLNPSKVKSIIIAGTPIDYVIDGGKLQMWLSMVNDTLIKNMIDYNDGIWPGVYQLYGFKLLNPVDRFIGTYNELWDYVEKNDEKNIKKWVRNNSWYEHVIDLPGKMIQEVCTDLFRKNKLIKKELELFGQIVDISNITCPIVTITGDDDDITLERQCRALADYVSTEDEYKKHYSIPDCGHIAIYLKSSAIEKWGEAINFVKESI